MFAPKNEYGHGFDRSQIEWYHPEAQEHPATPALLAEPGSTVFFDPDIPMEQKLAIGDMALQSILAGVQPEDLPAEVLDGFTEWKVEIPGCPEEPDAPAVPADVYVPGTIASKRRKPVIIFVAGGSLILCVPQIAKLHEYAWRTGAALVAPVYRTAIKGKYPAAINDLHATYQWVVDNAKEHGFDPNNIVIVGQSSGAHLAMSLAFRLKRFGYNPRGVVAYDVIVEDRQVYPSQNLATTGWNGIVNVNSSFLYLGADAGNPNLGPEAYPNRATVDDCKGLCPFFIHTNEHDPESDPAMHLSSKLRQAGVYTELHQWGGTCHGMLNGMGDTPYGERFFNVLFGNISDCVKYDLRRLKA